VEAETALGVCAALAACVPEWRRGGVRHRLETLVRQRVFQIACGYEDRDAADRRRTDPAFKLAGGRLPESEPDLASQPTFSRAENAVDRRAVERLAEALAERDLRERGRAGVPARILLDLDGTDDPAHGNQGGGGIDPTDAAWMLGLVSLVAIPGQIALGYLSDRIGRRSVWLAGSLGFALCYAALLLLQRSPTLPLLWVMVVAQGTLGYGLTSVIGAIPAETFPGRHHGTICGSLILASICGGAAGPWLTGTLYDLTGSYVPAFWIAIGVSVLGAVAVWIAAPPARPSSPSDPIRQREGAG